MLVGFDGVTAAEATEVSPAIQAGMLGAVVLFADGPYNVRSPEQVAALTSGLQALVPVGQPPLIIACDEEGGLVARLNDRFGFPATVSEQYMAANGLTEQSAAAMASTLAAAGVNLNLAPVVDVNVNPDNPIIGSLGRSFSGDPNVVAQQATIFVQAMHERGVRCTLKHFPGHGSSTSDSHLGFVDVTNTWTDGELIPFSEVIHQGLADAVMTAHVFNSNLDPDYPATLSHNTITGVLREQLGYGGVVYTDSITMHAITDFWTIPEAIELSINAGADMISISSGTIGTQPACDYIRAAIVDAVNAGRIPMERLDHSYARVMNLRRTIAGA